MDLKKKKGGQNLNNGRQKGFKQKKKTKYQVEQLKKFFASNYQGKWQKSDLQNLANRIQLDFKSVNKWMWDKKNKMELEKE